MPSNRTKTSTRRTDKPDVHFSFGKFDDTEIEPFVYMTKANHRIEFPDFFAEEAERAEELLTGWRRGDTTDGQVLKEWLPAEDWKALQDDKLSLRQRSQLMQMVMNHFDKYGDQGEDEASGS